VTPTTPPQRRPELRLWLDGRLMHDATWLSALTVDERVDAAAVATLTIPASPVEAGGGTWDTQLRGADALDLGMPELRLLTRLTIELSTVAVDDAAPPVEAVVFDGFVTAFEHRFTDPRVPDSTLVVTAMDASCLLHVETVTREWHGRSDAQVARDIFDRYGFAHDAASVEDSGPVRDLPVGTLLQRGTDAQFLRMLARRNGFELYVRPGGAPVTEGTHPRGGVVGHFHPPRTAADGQPDLSLFPADAPTLRDLTVTYGALEPTVVEGLHLDDRTRRLQRAEIDDPGYRRLGARSRHAVVTERLETILGGRPALTPRDLHSDEVPHHLADLSAITRSAYRAADWFARASGTVDAERYPAILRPGRPAAVGGAGPLLDGSWYVRGVVHRWGADREELESEALDRQYEADVTLVRNALEGQP
jgi:hypothetical protein